MWGGSCWAMSPSPGPGHVPIWHGWQSLDLGLLREQCVSGALPRLAHEAVPAEGLESPWGRGGGVQARGSLLPPPTPPWVPSPSTGGAQGCAEPTSSDAVSHLSSCPPPQAVSGLCTHPGTGCSLPLKTPAYLGSEGMSLSWCCHCPVASQPCTDCVCFPALPETPLRDSDGELWSPRSPGWAHVRRLHVCSERAGLGGAPRSTGSGSDV